jgi:hypothetical protein
MGTVLLLFQSTRAPLCLPARLFPPRILTNLIESSKPIHFADINGLLGTFCLGLRLVKSSGIILPGNSFLFDLSARPVLASDRWLNPQGKNISLMIHCLFGKLALVVTTVSSTWASPSGTLNLAHHVLHLCG